MMFLMFQLPMSSNLSSEKKQNAQLSSSKFNFDEVKKSVVLSITIQSNLFSQLKNSISENIESFNNTVKLLSTTEK